MSSRSASWKSLETGVNDDEEATEISVYPNPASTILNINLSSTINGNITLRFTDMSGKTFRVYNFTTFEGMNQYAINLDDFRDGIYFMGLTTGSQNYFRKIIIRK